MVVMVVVKRLAAFLLAASIFASSVGAFAYEDKNDGYYTSVEIHDSISQFGESVGAAELLDDDRQEDKEIVIYKELAKAIEEKQEQGKKCSVTVDGLEKLNLDGKIKIGEGGKLSPSDDMKKVFEAAMLLVLSATKYDMPIYNVTGVKGTLNKSDIVSSITVELDNSITIDEAVEDIVSTAAKRLKNDDRYNEYKDVFTKYPVAMFSNNSTELLAKVQSKSPELCYIQVLNVGMNVGVGYGQREETFNVDMTPSITFEYIKITRDEYTDFGNKLDEIVKTAVHDGMTDAQKAMALHDWIVENVKYGYMLDKSVYGGEGKDVVFNIDGYEKLLKLVDEETEQSMMEDRAKAHTAYGPAMSGYGVCQGYSLLYSALLTKVGIENGTIVSKSISHQWNTVKLDDEWYYIDATWDDANPADESKDEYYEVNLTTSDGGSIRLKFQTENYHLYKHFLCSAEDCIKKGHVIDDKSIIIPEEEFISDKYHARDDENNEATAHYAFEQVSDKQLYYGINDGLYYYRQNVIYKELTGDRIVTEYYKLPFVLKNEDGTFTEPVQVTEDEFNEAVLGIINDKDYVTVQIPDEDIINNSVAVEYKMKGDEETELSVDNIGSVVVAVTQREGSQNEIDEADAYLVYYGENRSVLDVKMTKVNLFSTENDIRFGVAAPEGAVEAKIIILDAGRELQPIIKAISASAKYDDSSKDNNDDENKNSENADQDKENSADVKTKASAA